MRISKTKNQIEIVYCDKEEKVFNYIKYSLYQNGYDFYEKDEERADLSVTCCTDGTHCKFTNSNKTELDNIRNIYIYAKKHFMENKYLIQMEDERLEKTFLFKLEKLHEELNINFDISSKETSKISSKISKVYEEYRLLKIKKYGYFL